MKTKYWSIPISVIAILLATTGIMPSPVIADPTYGITYIPETIYVGDTVYFTVTVPPITEGEPVPGIPGWSSSYWYFGDGTSSGWLGGTLSASHAYITEGTYYVGVWAYYFQWRYYEGRYQRIIRFLWYSTTINVLPLNEPPVADAGGPYTCDEGSPIAFDASGSSDPDGDVLQYRWDFDDDGTWDTEYSIDPIAPYTWGDDYSGTVVVEVYDGELTDTDTTSVTVNNVPPTASIDSFSYPAFVIFPGDEVSFTGSFTDPGMLDTHTILWDFDDGTVVTDTLTPPHEYVEAGEYTVTFTVIDDDGGVGTDTVQLVVKTTAEATQDVITTVEEWQLQTGIEDSLTSILKNAINLLERGRNNAAKNMLNAFINYVEAISSQSKLTSGQAEELITSAQAIIDHIE